ncbi:transport inhibitor response 1-like protein [Nymphaea colorata]|nr:transport inhibitor response 1-like protein [Nymphaea colorata]XP_031475651.1 transport inhibitor response 1-like protein [Nymphaea colorata]
MDPQCQDFGTETQKEKVETESSFPDEILEHILGFISERKDRNAFSLVCKSWFRLEALNRRHCFIGNCYAASPEVLIRRFPRVKSLVLKGKPRFADFNLVPQNWGAHLGPWVVAMVPAYPWLESLHLKRMSVKDEDLDIIASSLPKFKQLIIDCCDGFSTGGLASIASKCRELTDLELSEDHIDDNGADWLSCFPETTSLVSLSFECLNSDINFDALERLVSRSPSLKKLRLNNSVSISQLLKLMTKAPHLTHLGAGSFRDEVTPELALQLSAAFRRCKELKCLSGFYDFMPEYLQLIWPVCANLTSLNLSYAPIASDELEEIICFCHQLERLWVLDSVGDSGLQAVGSTCRNLKMLHVFPADAREDSPGGVSEEGLVAISKGCPNLESILYFCHRMTNDAVITMSLNCSNLTCFRLCIMGRRAPDHATEQPMDEGFGAIVKNCKSLTRLAVSGLLTDRAFEYIGLYGKLVRTLSVAFAGDSDRSLEFVLNGCTNLQKLEIRDSPFTDKSLFSGLHRYEEMRFLWMSGCNLTLEGCKRLAKLAPRLNVEVINENAVDASENQVEKLYLYRSLAGPRNDLPSFVSIL